MFKELDRVDKVVWWGGREVRFRFGRSDGADRGLEFAKGF